MMKTAGGIKSSLNDVMSFYEVWMKSVIAQFDGSTDSTPRSPFKQCRKIASHHASFEGSSLREQGYGLGWARAQLPGQLGRIVFNPIIGEEPIAGKGGRSRLVLYHHGLMPGSTSAALLVPELQLGVVVLQNSMPVIDTADFIAQLLLEALLEVPEPNDYVSLSQSFYDKAIGHVERVHKQLDGDRAPGTRPRPLSQYEGRYWNSLGNFYIDISINTQTETTDGMIMMMNGLPLQTYKLEHHHFDTFSWAMPYDEMVRRGRVLSYEAEYYLIGFEASGKNVAKLLWAADSNFPHTPIILTKPNITNKQTDGTFVKSQIFLWSMGICIAFGSFLAWKYIRWNRSSRTDIARRYPRAMTYQALPPTQDEGKVPFMLEG